MLRFISIFVCCLMLAACAHQGVNVVYSDIAPNHVLATAIGQDTDGLFGTNNKWSDRILIETEANKETGEKTAKSAIPIHSADASAPAPAQAVFNAAASSAASTGFMTWFTGWLPKPQTDVTVSTGTETKK